MPSRYLLLLVSAASLVASCNPSKSGDSAASAESAAKSPNATIVPAPLDSSAPANAGDPQDKKLDSPAGIPADSKGRLIVPDGGPPAPIASPAAEPLPADVISQRELPGITLQAEWLWSNVPPPAHTPEVSNAGIDAARKATKRTWQIDIAEVGRMRIVVDSFSFTVTKLTELRARYDRYGHALVWPNIDAYRVVPPGALRALLDERRVDVSPLMQPQVSPSKPGNSRFGFPTSKNTISTATGKVVLEQAHTTNAGLGGQLLCRTLIELVSADPATTVCSQGLLPIHADYTWPDNTTISFDVSAFTIRPDFPSIYFTTPPATATFTPTGLPPEPSGIFLTREQVAAFRSKPIDSTRPRTDSEFKGAPGEGFEAVNDTDALRFILIDGVPVAWVPAHGKQYVIGSLHGRYTVQWRSFLGASIAPPKTIEIPALITFPEPPDAGTADGGKSN
jgi:hypothetical protein